MKKYYRRSFALLLIIHVTQFARAQFDAMFSQYMYNEMFINPGYTGSREAMSSTLLHRQQWLNFPGRPVTTTFSLHGPLMQNKMGLGLSILNEKIGVLNRNLAYASYAYRIRTGEKSTLALGLNAGIHNQLYRFSELKTSRDGSPDPNVAQNSPNLIAFNCGAGLYFSTPTFYTGISIPRLLDDRVRFANGEAVKTIEFDPSSLHYYFTIGKLFNLGKNLALKTQGMAKAVSGAPVQLDLNANFLLYRSLWLGAGYRTNAAAIAFIGFQINPQLFIGYSYDYDLNGIQRYTGGSHEIVLSYLFYFDVKKVLSPRYF